jgi:hypothetical protein
MRGLFAPESPQWRRSGSRAEECVLAHFLPVVGNRTPFLQVQRRNGFVQRPELRWPGKQTGAARIVVCMSLRLRGKLKLGVIALRRCESRLGWRSPRRAALAGCLDRCMGRR